jgi:hypothetical protein
VRACQHVQDSQEGKEEGASVSKRARERVCQLIQDGEGKGTSMRERERARPQGEACEGASMRWPLAKKKSTDLTCDWKGWGRAGSAQ